MGHGGGRRGKRRLSLPSRRQVTRSRGRHPPAAARGRVSRYNGGRGLQSRGLPAPPASSFCLPDEKIGLSAEEVTRSPGVGGKEGADGTMIERVRVMMMPGCCFIFSIFCI